MYPDLSGTGDSEDQLMAKKQSDYLADLLAEEAAEAPQKPVEADSAPSPNATPHRAGMSLLGRESALARVASGEVKQVTQLQLEPERVRIWEGNARLQAQLNEDNVRDLIDSILSEGGQKVPVIVRRVNGDPQFDYEVVAGTRRHFAISWLRKNSYPEMRLLAQVADLDDEAAFRLADVENRARKDVSDFERARNYLNALETHYAGKQRRMAERLRLNESWLSRILKVATLPDALVDCFASIHDIQVKPAYPLAVWCTDLTNRGIAIDRGYKLADQQKARRSKGLPPMGSAEVIRQLMQGLDSSKVPSPAPLAVNGPLGRPMVSLAGRNRQGLTLKLHAASGASAEQVIDGVRELLSQLEAEGKGLEK
jgi:ParB family transcriptional regulator, chromosome partitioning protein